MSYTPQFVLDFREILQSSISKIVMHRNTTHLQTLEAIASNSKWISLIQNFPHNRFLTLDKTS